MNKRGFELAISTVVVIVISVSVLIGLIFILQEGFEEFQSGTKPILESIEGIAIKEACELSCLAENKINYCCKEFDYDSEKIFCKDSRLEIACDLDCAEFVCE